MQPSIAVVIAGPISAGKSTLLGRLAERHQWCIVSFGEYVRSVARDRSLAVDRRTLQDLGHEIFRSLGPRAFLDAVIERAGPNSVVSLFDGVRDVAIVSALRQTHRESITIYLDVSDLTRYERHRIRLNKDSLAFTFKDFMELSNHPIERGIEELPRSADEIIRVTSESIEEVIDDIERRLNRRGIL